MTSRKDYRAHVAVKNKTEFRDAPYDLLFFISLVISTICLCNLRFSFWVNLIVGLIGAIFFADCVLLLILCDPIGEKRASQNFKKRKR